MIINTYDSHPLDFLELLKPRVMSLSIFTAFCGMILAPGNIHPLLGFGAILCIAIGAGAAGCLNMWCEIHRDTLMKRTQMRPLPSGRIDPNSAIAFGAILSVLSVGLLGIITNWIASLYLLITILFYVFVYTLYLKPRTPQNIVIGGAAGALPPVIGWACVTGHADLTAWALFAIIFLWTPAHFWALCLEQHEDYDHAGFPMLPNTHGPDVTRRGILRYTVLTVACSFTLVYLQHLSLFYTISAVLLGIIFITEAYRVYYKKISSKRLFFISIIYLFLLFTSMLAHHFLSYITSLFV
ncbi:MAG: heme o synthase [Candidatus Paracaedibacteraceae bacterium]|nr:heme o synthase [Candidatus Paracaedibacteraceae bacterium]